MRHLHQITLAILSALIIVLGTEIGSVWLDSQRHAGAAPAMQRPFTSLPAPALQPTPLTEQWTANTRLYQTGPRSFTLDSSVGPLNYQDATGAWQEIDESASSPDVDGFSVRWTELPYYFRLADSSFRCVYPDRNDTSYYFCLDKPFPSMGTPVRDGNTFTWDFPSASIVIQVQSAAVKFTSVLKDSSAPTSMTIPFTSEGITRQGQFLYHQGEVVAELRRPVATDADYDRAGQGIKRDVGVTWATDSVTLTLDTTGMAYPISVDPTLDLQVGASADDVEWDSFAGFTSNATIQPFGRYGGTTGAENVARLTNVTVPQGATIVVAYGTYTASATRSGTTVLTNMYFEDVDNATQIVSRADWTGRSLTSGVAWDSVPTFTGEAEYDTPSLVVPFQVVVDRAGFASGSAVNFFHHNDGSDSGAVRAGYSYDGDTSKAFQFHVEYTVLARRIIIVVGD